jgi:protein SCO1
MMRKILFLTLLTTLIISFQGCAQKPQVSNKDFSNFDKIDSKLIPKDSKYKLLFFGYAGCYHFCDPRLRQIDPIFTALKKELDISMLFIDISDGQHLKASQEFVKAVNPEFEAIDPDDEQTKVLQQKIKDLYVRKLPDGEYLHSGFLYLLQEHEERYYLIKLYPEFINAKAVIENIKKIVKH